MNNDNQEPITPESNEPNTGITSTPLEPELSTLAKPDTQPEKPTTPPDAPRPTDTVPTIISDTPEPVLPAQETPQPAPIARPARKRKLALVVSIAIAMLLAAIGTVLALTVLQKDSSDQKQTESVAKVTLMGAEVTIADGTIQISTDNKTWQDAAVGVQIKQGMYVRTQPAARAVIALDDGSAIRLNSSSVVHVDSLGAKNIVITNVSGEVYTRVVASSRKFTVKVADEQYLAMGTAYKTINTTETNGVEVYHSSVSVVKKNVAVAEGKYYYLKSADASQQQKLSDISIDKIKQDTFVAWNYEQDKQQSEFKDKLGYLTKIDEPVAVKTQTQTTTQTTQTTQSKITLSGKAYDGGVKLTWSLTGLTAPKGFKVVKSLSANPSYGKDDAVYVSKSTSTSYAWTIQNGKTYHFRVCIYTGDGCSIYSNDVTVTAPLVSEAEPSGTLSLTAGSGKTVSWTMDGTAPKGFKLVWSTTTAPVYPGSSYNYYSDQATRSGTVDADPGTYYVRVCMYTGSGCTNYSNEITVTIP